MTRFTDKVVIVTGGASGLGLAAAQRLADEGGQMLVFSDGVSAELTAETAATIMALGGEPLGPRFIEWNFVSSRKERIEQAKADWRAGRMKLPDLDGEEWIPLPPDPAPPANPVS